MRSLILILALIAPVAAMAAGSDDDSPPKSTKTTTVCKTGFVYDDKIKKCVAPKESSLNDDQLYQAARELAYAGRFEDALLTLAAMSDQTESRVLTYYGFAHRKAGRIATGMSYYRSALRADPDNLLARSYMGQGLLASGNVKAARAQLQEIRARGGRETWAEVSLRQAIRTGKGFSY
ncbi:MAG: tetratricopeptide repeat protein [Pseudomonadota bacterium]